MSSIPGMDRESMVTFVPVGIAFVLVETHFYTILKHDPYARSIGIIRTICLLSMLSGFVHLAVLFMHVFPPSDNTIVWKVRCWNFLGTTALCCSISSIKSLLICQKMIQERKVHFIWAVLMKSSMALMFVGTVLPLAQFTRLAISFWMAGVFLWVCLTLTHLECRGAPKVIQRMQSSFANAGTLVLMFCIVFTQWLSGIIDSLENLRNANHQLTRLFPLFAFLIFALWTQILRITGHHVLDCCAGPPPDLNYHFDHDAHEDELDEELELLSRDFQKSLSSPSQEQLI
eukprot:TRINITY_DN3068_c0_g1_i1.p1 TRINITY_DN3068_c0_g1~~TRINITY_DN3068_c0_g1_i1.p1  ORF type:complete len:296 (-),score=43.40 TRINITY_DN3068_c0_g1_i1:64-924(-)